MRATVSEPYCEAPERLWDATSADRFGLLPRDAKVLDREEALYVPPLTGMLTEDNFQDYRNAVAELNYRLMQVSSGNAPVVDFTSQFTVHLQWFVDTVSQLESSSDA